MIFAYCEIVACHKQLQFESGSVLSAELARLHALASNAQERVADANGILLRVDLCHGRS